MKKIKGAHIHFITTDLCRVSCCSHAKEVLKRVEEGRLTDECACEWGRLNVWRTAEEKEEKND